MLAALGALAVGVLFFPAFRLAKTLGTQKWIHRVFLVWLVACALYFLGIFFAYMGHESTVFLFALFGVLVQWVSALILYVTYLLLRRLQLRSKQKLKKEHEFRVLNESLERVVSSRTAALSEAINSIHTAQQEARDVSIALDQQLLEVEQFHQRGREFRSALPFVKIASHTESADRINGDFFHCVDWPDGSFSFFLGDAMGHGAGAGMLTAHVRGALSVLPRPQALETMAESLHQSFSTEDIEGYITAVLGNVSPDGKLCICHCGHPPSAILRSGGGWESPFSSECPALGMLDWVPLDAQTQSLMLSPGDTLFLFSDGLDSLYRQGSQRDVALSILAGVNEEAEPVDQIHAALEKIYSDLGAGQLDDDFTLIAIRYTQ